MQGYYSGGMVMPDRSFSYENYRFGFNGKLNDNDVQGPGNSYNYGYRIYDPRIGRFLSLDPLHKKFPFYSPYQFAGNKPIWAIDIDGMEEAIVTLGRNEDGSIVSVSTTYQINEKGHKVDLRLHDAEGNYPFKPTDILVVDKKADGSKTYKVIPNLSQVDNLVKKVINTKSFEYSKRKAVIEDEKYKQDLSQNNFVQVNHRAGINSYSFNISPTDPSSTEKATEVIADLSKVDKVFRVTNMTLPAESLVKEQLSSKGVSEDQFTELAIDNIPKDKNPKVVVGTLQKETPSPTKKIEHE